MLTFYYIVFFALTLVSCIELLMFKEVDRFSQQIRQKSFSPDSLSPVRTLYVLLNLFAFVWYVTGLLTPQWGFILTYVLLAFPLFFLTKRYQATRFLFRLLSLAFHLFMVINYFHLHYTTADLIAGQ